MLAQKDKYIEEASATIYELSQEENIRLQCEAREDYYRRQRSIQNQIKNLERTITEKDDVIAEKDTAIAEKDAVIANQKALITALKSEIEQLKK